jgi:uncharacterized RDD family membrane protein YckC
MSTIKVKTTQNVEVEYELASVGDRVIAHFIDIAVYIAYCIGIGLLVSLMDSPGNNSFFQVLLIIAFLPLVLYNLLCEIFMNGQSLGKKAKDIKVVKLNGVAPSIGDYLLRWIFRIVDTFMFGGLVATISVGATERNQRLGDLAAGTTVIRTRPVKREQFLNIRPNEDYQIMFPEVNLLSDKDIALIRKLFYKARQHQNSALLEKVAERTKSATGIITDLNDKDFLITILKDHHHATQFAEA